MTVPFHQLAIDRLSDFFSQRPETRPLGSAERQDLRKNGRHISAAWRTGLPVDGRSVETVVTVDENYPYSCPRILVPGDHYMKYPHVEEDGGLCLLPKDASFSHDHPVDVMVDLLADASRLLEQGYAGENRDDFINEFQNYWTARSPREHPLISSLIDPAPPTRTVYSLKNGRRRVLGQNRDTCQRWLEHRGLTEAKLEGEKSIFLWLDRPLYPEDYPQKGSDVRRLLEWAGPGALTAVTEKLPQRLTPFVLPFGFATNNGPALGAMYIWPTCDRKGRPDIPGFRRGKIPPERLAISYFSSNVVQCLPVTRVDPAWIHTRGGSGLGDQLKDKQVCVIGCGSLGADVALLLAKAGVGKILLIDGDTLTWDNIGRHLLGAESIGLRKDRALADYLRRQLPHLHVEFAADAANWQEVQRKAPALMAGYDLILSMTANWSSDSHLNRLARKSANFPPVVFGWFEGYACAGHALVVTDLGGCLHCGMDELGHFCYPVTSWKASSLRQAPACGAYYQPYGAVETLPVKMLVAETALDVLLNKTERSELRTWIGNGETLQRCGGQWNTEWTERYGNPDAGKIIVQELWPINPVCALCN